MSVRMWRYKGKMWDISELVAQLLSAFYSGTIAQHVAMSFWSLPCPTMYCGIREHILQEPHVETPSMAVMLALTSTLSNITASKHEELNVSYLSTRRQVMIETQRKLWAINATMSMYFIRPTSYVLHDYHL